MLGGPIDRWSLWVKSRHVQRKRLCLLYPQKRRSVRSTECPLRAKSELMRCINYDQSSARSAQSAGHLDRALSGRDVDNELKFGGLLDRDIARLRALKNRPHSRQHVVEGRRRSSVVPIWRRSAR